jgi:hypothetical protein
MIGVLGLLVDEVELGPNLGNRGLIDGPDFRRVRIGAVKGRYHVSGARLQYCLATRLLSKSKGCITVQLVHGSLATNSGSGKTSKQTCAANGMKQKLCFG